MKIANKTNIPEVIILDSETHCDSRGFLRIGYSKEELQQLGIDFNIEQINYGYSVLEHTLRGMHYQEGERAQAKLVSCHQGKLYSVAIDIRKDSPTYGKWTGETLTPENGKCMYIPKGFAHGYITIQPNTLLQYCVDAPFHGPSAKSISYKSFDIQWPCPIDENTLSDKDKNAMTFEKYNQSQRNNGEPNNLGDSAKNLGENLGD